MCSRKRETNLHPVSFRDEVLNGLLEIGVALVKHGYEVLVFFQAPQVMYMVNDVRCDKLVEYGEVLLLASLRNEGFKIALNCRLACVPVEEAADHARFYIISASLSKLSSMLSILFLNKSYSLG